MITIYTLVDPVTKRVRYVGQTAQIPQRRLRQHISYSGKRPTHSASWIQSLAQQGLEPSLYVLETVPPEIADERERYWIQQYPDLTNHTDGGSGQFRHDQDTKDRLSIIAAQRVPRSGFHQTQQHKARIGLANRGSLNGQAKLTDAVAQQIKIVATTTDLSHTQISSIYGVSRRLVSMIARGERWSHLP